MESRAYPEDDLGVIAPLTPAPVSKPVVTAIASAFQERHHASLSDVFNNEVAAFTIGADTRLQPASAGASKLLITSGGRRFEQRFNALLSAADNGKLPMQLNEVHLALTERGQVASTLSGAGTGYPKRVGARDGVPGWTADAVMRERGTLVGWSKADANQWWSIDSIARDMVDGATKTASSALGLYDKGRISLDGAMGSALMLEDAAAPAVAKASYVMLHEMYHAKDSDRHYQPAEGAASVFGLLTLPSAMKAMGVPAGDAQKSSVQVFAAAPTYSDAVRGWSQLAKWAGHSLNTAQGRSAVRELLSSTPSNVAWDNLTARALSSRDIEFDFNRNGGPFSGLQWADGKRAAKILGATETKQPLSWLGISDPAIGAS